MARWSDNHSSLEESFEFNEAAHRKGFELLIGKQPETCVAVAEQNGKTLLAYLDKSGREEMLVKPNSLWTKTMARHSIFTIESPGKRLAFLVLERC